MPRANHEPVQQQLQTSFSGRLCLLLEGDDTLCFDHLECGTHMPNIPVVLNNKS